MSSARLERVAEQIKKEIGRILQDELNDPRIGFVTLTKVELTSDLHQAKVYFSHLGSPKELKDTQVGLSRSAGFIRRLLGQRIKIRYTPKVIFKLDRNVEHSIHISQILGQIEQQDKKNEQT